jgi:enoyl-CoA hydratase/carnithine racemase
LGTSSRPEVINALTHGMIRRSTGRWRTGRRTTRAVRGDHGADERGLCAGGDTRAIYSDIPTPRTARRPARTSAGTSTGGSLATASQSWIMRALVMGLVADRRLSPGRLGERILARLDG